MTRRQAREVVRACPECQALDPAPVKWKRGSLSVQEIWERLAVDVTHVNTQQFLSIIDCGPSRFAIWRPLRRQDSSSVCEQLETVFLERGAPRELLADNTTVFHGRQFQELLRKWDVNIHFRTAYEPAGNGIVERNHRTIKTMVARSRCTVAEAVHLYNMTPTDGRSEATAPASRLYRYRMRVRPIDVDTRDGPESGLVNKEHCGYAVGDSVWIRRRGSRCFVRSKLGRVTAILSELSIEVDGIPHHIRNLRPCLQQRRVCAREVTRTRSEEESVPLMITVPSTSSQPEVPPSLSAPAVTSDTGSERCVFTLPSRSSVRCLRVNPVRRQM